MDAHVTKEPFDRDLRRRQLAHRLVVHQARTRTIFYLTGLSRHQLATLRRRWRITTRTRRRGPSPTSFTALQSTQRLRAEAAALAVFWRTLGNLDVSNEAAQRSISTLEFGERLCEVFEAFLACFPKSALELEHLMMLARGLEKADAIGLSTCATCEGVVVVDLLGVRRRLCSQCQRAADAVARPLVNADAITPSVLTPSSGEGVQQELF